MSKSEIKRMALQDPWALVEQIEQLTRENDRLKFYSVDTVERLTRERDELRRVVMATEPDAVLQPQIEQLTRELDEAREAAKWQLQISKAHWDRIVELRTAIEDSLNCAHDRKKTMEYRLVAIMETLRDALQPVSQDT